MHQRRRPQMTSLEVAHASTPRSRSRRHVTNQPDFATEPDVAASQPPNPALQPTANPLRGLSAAELGR